MRPDHLAQPLSLLMASKFCDVKFTTAMYASLPLYLVFFGTIAFCIFLPDVVFWLPKQVLPESVGCFESPTGAGYMCPQLMGPLRGKLLASGCGVAQIEDVDDPAPSGNWMS